jgi:hypothetical protein
MQARPPIPPPRHARRARALFVASLIVATAILPTSRAIAQQTPSPTTRPGALSRPNVVRGDEITPAQQLAVERGLAFLASRQAANGSYGGDGMGQQAAITALAGLAFMEAGNLPGRGKYGENVTHCVDAILGRCQESGLIAGDQSHGPMYGHGFATLFLGEIYGMTGDEAVKERLQKAVRLIERTQNHEGGWRYQPAPLDADISVTICQVMALRAARDAGIKVDKSVIENSIRYVRNCQNADGGFSYQVRQGPSGFARSAAGVASLYYAGIFEGDDITRGLTYISTFMPAKDAGASPETEAHYYYGNYYAVQAMFLAGGDWWATWYPAVRDQLIARQNRETGAWSGDFSEEYATSMALIILQMPNRYLPVYMGKGPGD